MCYGLVASISEFITLCLQILKVKGSTSSQKYLPTVLKLKYFNSCGTNTHYFDSFKVFYTKHL